MPKSCPVSRKEEQTKNNVVNVIKWNDGVFQTGNKTKAERLCILLIQRPTEVRQLVKMEEILASYFSDLLQWSQGPPRPMITDKKTRIKRVQPAQIRDVCCKRLSLRGKTRKLLKQSHRYWTLRNSVIFCQYLLSVSSYGTFWK